VLWVTSRLSTFADFWRSVLEGDNDVVALVRDDGAVLVRYPPLSPPTGQHIPPIGGQMDAAHAAAIKQPGTVARIEAASPFDGEIRTYFARRLPGLPVTILYGLHPAGPRDIWLHQVRVIATVTAVSAAVLLWLTWLASERARRENLAQARARMEAERRAGAEAALRKGQRLEVLGQLAAGVAHDFRNVVQAVQCGITLARNAAAAGDRAKADAVLTMAFDAAGRGAALTERMLDVAGRRPDGLETPAVADPVATVNATAGLLEQTMGRRFQVQVVAPVGGGRCPASVRGTQAELEAALLNLAVNARDAMPDGGSLCIAVSRDEVTGDQAHPAGLSPGHYAGITVADTGVGMDAATLRRATEAFFTTKPPGQGTGLGLASVRAFVGGVGGGLQLESPGPGRGTTVKMWLPESATSVDGKRQLTPAR
jgi:signal transduction histidine kinase